MISLFSNRPDGADTEWLDQHADDWVEHGLVTSDQVEAIRSYEHHDTPASPRLSIVAELAVYLGSVLALMSGAMMVGQSWETLRTGGQVAIGVAIAALGFVAGARLVGLGDAGTRRLASFMWLIGTGGVALTTGVIVDTVGFDQPGWNVLIVGLPVLAIGAVLWRNLDRPLQVLTTAVGAGLTFGGVGALLSTPPWIGGILVWLAAIAIGAAAITQRLRPELYVLAVAAIAAMIGAAMLADASELAASIAATLTAAGIVAVGLVRHLVPILVVGVIAFLQGLQGLLIITLHGAAAAAVVAAGGIVVVIVVIARSTRGSKPAGGPGEANL
ncbi:MAG: DUF2157 domain-containing protein [Ilumatobacteraceae bacterium]